MKMQDITKGTTITDELGERYIIQHINSGGLCYTYSLDGGEDRQLTTREIAANFNLAHERDIKVETGHNGGHVEFWITTLPDSDIAYFLDGEILEKFQKEYKGLIIADQDALDAWLDDMPNDFTYEEVEYITESLLG